MLFDKLTIFCSTHIGSHGNLVFKILQLVAVALVALHPTAGISQIILPGGALESRNVESEITSGVIRNASDSSSVLWEQVVTVADAKWLRLSFDQLVLGENPLGGPSSLLRITSMEDGAVQILSAESARQWKNTSAYFNGDAVRLELFAAPNDRMNLVSVNQIVAGEQVNAIFPRSICDVQDDRILATDARIGRTAPGGCTAWLFDDRTNCMLTAGHCAESTEVILFNTPISDEERNPRFPGPEDQYAVDFESVQFLDAGIGHDFCYFGCFPNSTTGLSAFGAQGDSFRLIDPATVSITEGQIRITGHGISSDPVDPTWSQALTTNVGEFVRNEDGRIGYRADTTGGNSGSPVIFEPTGEAVGIHTHGGCDDDGGMNQGTPASFGMLQDALTNPLGVCLAEIDFAFPNSRPEIVSPQGGLTLSIQISDEEINLQPSTATFHVDYGDGMQELPMVSIGDDLFEATFPATPCASIVRYHFSIRSDEGTQFFLPPEVPENSFLVISAESGVVPFDDDFEADQGWTVSGSASDGQWERAIPAGNGVRGDPPADADGSGFCFVTDNEIGNSDVDGGETVLTSPIFDATTAGEQAAVVSYFRWYNNESEGDSMEIQISNDAGDNWITVESVSNGAGSVGGWLLQFFNVADFIETSNQMQVRFIVSDIGSTSIIEAGVDAFSVQMFDCEQATLLGDVNLDGVVDLLDVGPFVSVIQNVQFQQEADIDGNGVVDLLDVGPFVSLLSN